MKKRQKVWILIGLIITLTLVGACGRLDVAIEGTPTEPPPSENADQAPSNVLQVLDNTLDVLQASYPDEAPSGDLNWLTSDLTPPGLVGAGGYRFSSENWQIDITYPIVAPDSMIYTVTVDHLGSTFHWQGTFNADGQLLSEPSAGMEAVAWPGSVVSGDQTGDLNFEISGGAGTVGLSSSDDAIWNRLTAIENDTGPQGFVHVWGTLDCSSTSERQCSLEVTRIRSGTEITEPEPVGPWEGVLFARTGPPASGGDDWFTLNGDWPIQYGIWALDETVRSQLESLRDTGQVIRIWGELTVGIPDWNGTQINVTRFEFIE